jgi:hypothetical protein
VRLIAMMVPATKSQNNQGFVAATANHTTMSPNLLGLVKQIVNPCASLNAGYFEELMPAWLIVASMAHCSDR